MHAFCQIDAKKCKNPFVSPSAVESTNADYSPVNMCIVVLFVGIGMAFGTYNIFGTEGYSFIADSGETIEIKHAKASSMANWAWAICSPFIGVIAGFIFLRLLRYFRP